MRSRPSVLRSVPALALALSLLPAPARSEILAFVGARVLPATGSEIERGTVIVDGGRIVAVGAIDEIEIPVNARRIALDGHVLMPGLVDTHSHLGRGSGGDRSSPLHPDVRMLDAIDVGAENLWKARAGGITSVNVMPGSGHLMSGQTVYLKLRLGGRDVDDYLLCADPGRTICGGLKMANGTNSQRQPPFPGSRAKSAALVRELWVKALDYRAKIERAKGDAAKLPARDLGMETLLEVLDGKRVVHHHTHRHDDILTVLRIAGEFGYRPVLHHISEAWKVADEIAAAGAACSIIGLDSPGGKHEAVDLSWENGAALERAGALVGFHTDDGITDSRHFLRSAAFQVRAGMSREKAIEGLTIAGARMLGLGDRIGTIEPGKDADLVVLSGDPFSVYTRVEETWVEGTRVYSRADEGRYATGGFGVYPSDADHGDDEFEESGR